MEKKRSSNSSQAKFSWVGYPDDLGVSNTKGRPGAKEGPARFEELFLKLNGRFPVLSRLKEGGSVPMGQDLEENYRNAVSTTKSRILALNLKTDALVSVGGGHDYGYVWFKAVREALPAKTRIACINFDAHFDLRPYDSGMTSGSPFRRLIEEKLLDPKLLVEFGIQAHCNGPELWDYAKEKKISIIPFENLRNGKAVPEFKKVLTRLKQKADVVLISLDLDALSFAFAPGVSAPQAEGFSASEIFQMLEIAGSDKKVTSLGVFELCPPLDFQNLTARLAAQAVWHFLNQKLK